MLNPFKRRSRKQVKSPSESSGSRKESFSLESPPSTHEILEREPSMVPVLVRPEEPSQIEELFRETVDKMALPKAATERMWTLPLNQKWQIVQDWSKKEQDRQHESEGRQPFYWIQKLQALRFDTATHLSEEEARELHVLMRGSNKEWIHKFHRHGGVAALCEYMEALSFRSANEASVVCDPADQTNAILLECLRCYKTLMNNPFGMELLLSSTDNHIDLLARCLHFTSHSQQEVTMAVLEMLSVFCWYSEQGQHSVLQAMTAYRRLHKERAKYYSLVQCLKSTENVELQVACVTFINTLVSASSHLEARVNVRNDFLALDFVAICQAIQTKLEAPPSPRLMGATFSSIRAREKPSVRIFIKQFHVFQGLMHSDMEDAVASDVDLTNADAVWMKLQQWTSRHGFSDRLLHVLLALMGIPGEATIGGKMWSLVEEALMQITSLHTYKDLDSVPHRLSYEWVRELQETVEAFDAQVQKIATLESTIAALEAQSKRCHATVKARDQQIRGLQDEIEAILLEQLKHQSIICEATQTSIDVAHVSLQTGSSRLYSNDSATQTESEKQEAVPPPATSSYAKYCRLIKLGMPREQVELKMRAENIDPTGLDSYMNASESKAKGSEDDAKYEKYFKLQKMGMPKEQIRVKIQVDGLDPSVWDRMEAIRINGSPPELKAEPVRPNPAEKYLKLIKMGMPREQVELKMKAEGVSHLLLDAPGSEPEQRPVPETEEARPATQSNPAHEKYFKLIKMGMPKEQVALKMKADGYDPSVLESSSPTPPASQASSQVIVDPKIEKYLKLIKMGMPKEQVALKMKSEGLDPSLLESASNPIASTVPSTQPTDAIDPAYAKYIKLIKMGMPIEQVKLKAKADGLDPTKLSASQASLTTSTDCTHQNHPTSQMQRSTAESSSLGAKPSSSSTKPTPPVIATPTPPPYKLPPKRTIVPSVKLRCLFWTPLPEAALEKTVWLQLDDSNLGLEFSVLDKEFGQDGKKEVVTTSPTKAAIQKTKIIQLVDPKRQQNCSIALSRFRMSPKDINQAILLLDEKVLTLEKIQSLSAMVPTAEELELVKGYDGDVSLLGETEKFFLAISDIPRLGQRLQAMESSLTFGQRFEDVKSKLKALEQAYVDVKGSKKLLDVLEIVLAVGNYLNGGTSRGAAWGFKLEILPKLSQVKATSSKNKTLMHCIVEFVQQHAPHADNFYESLKSLEDISSISFTLLQSDFTAIEKSMQQIEQEKQHQEAEEFGVKMGIFLTSAQSDCQSLRQNINDYENKFHALALSFGVDSTKVSDMDAVQSFFGTWIEFCKSYKKVSMELQTKKDKMIKQDAARVKADESKRDLFQQFTASLEGDANDIVANFKSRHRHIDMNAEAPKAKSRRNLSRTIDAAAMLLTTGMEDEAIHQVDEWPDTLIFGAIISVLVCLLTTLYYVSFERARAVSKEEILTKPTPTKFEQFVASALEQHKLVLFTLGTEIPVHRICERNVIAIHHVNLDRIAGKKSILDTFLRDVPIEQQDSNEFLFVNGKFQGNSTTIVTMARTGILGERLGLKITVDEEAKEISILQPTVITKTSPGPPTSIECLASWKSLPKHKLSHRVPLANRPRTAQNQRSQLLVTISSSALNDVILPWEIIDTIVILDPTLSCCVPSSSWIDAAHRNGVRVLASVKFTSNSDQTTAIALAHVQGFFGFDGWLVDFTDPLVNETIPVLKGTGNYLQVASTLITRSLFDSVDNVVIKGSVQDKAELQQVVKIVGEHHRHVFFRCQNDVASGVSARILRFNEVSVHIPLEDCMDEFWAKNWRRLSPLYDAHAGIETFYTSFNTGSGKKSFIQGACASEMTWQDKGQTDTLPLFGLQSTFQVSYRNDVAYHGGSCLEFSINLQAKERASMSLFPAQFYFQPLKYLYISYTFRSDTPTSFGLELKLASNEVVVLRGNDSVNENLVASPLIGRSKHSLVYGPIAESIENEWNTRTYHLGGSLLESKSVTGISVYGINLQSEPVRWSACIGQLVVCQYGSIPAETLPLHIDHDPKEGVLRWSPPSGHLIQYTHIFEEIEGNELRHIGRTNDFELDITSGAACDQVLVLQGVSWYGALGPLQRISIRYVDR